MKTVYVETSIVSYLTARPSRDVMVAAWQNATVCWWETRRQKYDLYTSRLVVEEAELGDADAAARRIKALAPIPHLSIAPGVTQLARALIQAGALPSKAADDAMHVAISAYHGVDYLLTWNCRHIDNAEMKPLMRSICAIRNISCPEICTPLELMGDDADER